MRSFATAMELAESDEEMFDTLMQIITVGLCLKGNVTNCRYMYGGCYFNVFLIILENTSDQRFFLVSSTVVLAKKDLNILLVTVSLLMSACCVQHMVV